MGSNLLLYTFISKNSTHNAPLSSCYCLVSKVDYLGLVIDRRKICYSTDRLSAVDASDGWWSSFFLSSSCVLSGLTSFESSPLPVKDAADDTILLGIEMFRVSLAESGIGHSILEIRKFLLLSVINGYGVLRYETRSVLVGCLSVVSCWIRRRRIGT